MSKNLCATYTGPLTANGLKIWLSSCEDAFENYQDTHKDSVLVAKTRIRMTGSALAVPDMAQWWTASKSDYLALASWDAFVEKLKKRFLQVNWKTDALEHFFGCNQGKRDFGTFATDLAQSVGTLPSGTISTTMHKYHLLFYCHNLLYLRMRALQGFDIDATTQTTDELIALMTAQWSSLVAEHASRSGRSLPLSSSTIVPSSVPLTMSASTPAPTVVTSSPRFVPLTDEEKATLSALHGCWNCRATPADPGWVPHQRHTCPGNPSIGARPGKDYVAPTATTVIAGAAFASGLEYPDENTESDTDSD